jgi:hypothetical protein
MSQASRRGLVAGVLAPLVLVVATGCKSRQFNPASVLSPLEADIAVLPGEVEAPSGFLEGLLAAPGSAERRMAGDALARAVAEAFDESNGESNDEANDGQTRPQQGTTTSSGMPQTPGGSSPGVTGVSGSTGLGGEERRLARTILTATADYLRSPNSCGDASKVTLYVGYDKAPLVRRRGASLAEATFLIPGWQEVFERVGEGALKEVPVPLGDWLGGGPPNEKLDWAVMAGATTPGSKGTALLLASLDPLVAETQSDAVIAARVCPQRVLMAIDSTNLPAFSVYVPFFLLPEEIEEVADVQALPCNPSRGPCPVKNSVSDAFVETSGNRDVDKRYRGAYLHFPADGEILQEALDGTEDPALTLSEVAFERIKADFYGQILEAGGGDAFAMRVGEGRVPRAATDCAQAFETWKEFETQAAKPGDDNLWTSGSRLGKYKEHYKTFLSEESGCQLP